MKGFNILIVEDDSMISKSLKTLLESNGANVVLNQTGENIEKQLEDIHLILMDIMLPYDNGINITRNLREHSNIPIIFLSARNDIDTKLSGLKNGEDYVTKPFHPLELIARINKLLDKTYDQSFNRFYHLHIDTLNKCIYDEKKNEINLTKTERELFFYLYMNKNMILTKEQLLSFIWPDGDGMENTLNVYIRKLRMKINDEANDIIKTVYGIGYRMNSYEK